MEKQEFKNGWFSPENDARLRQDFRRNCPITSDIVAIAFFAIFFLCIIVGTLSSPDSPYETPQKIFMTILMFVAIAIVCVWQGIKIFKKIYRIMHYDFYVRTCYLENFRVVTKTTGSNRRDDKRTYTYYYITVTDGYHVAEYKCNTNPHFSPQELNSHKEITLATIADLKVSNHIGMVYVLDEVYPEYRG